MKILKVKLLSDFRMLRSGFEIDFTTKARVSRETDELIQLQNGLYYPTETILIGKNSSGKSTTIDLLELTIGLLSSGRILKAMLQEEDDLKLDILFYDRGGTFEYIGSFTKNGTTNNDLFLKITNEELLVVKKTNRSKSPSNWSFGPHPAFKAADGGDTSGLATLEMKDASLFVDLMDLDFTLDASIILNQIYKTDIFTQAIRLFDDSIERITIPSDPDVAKTGILFKRVNKPEILVNRQTFGNMLSSGTRRGLILLVASLTAFKYGGTILIDEIEKSFNKNLIENLLVLFRDKRINEAQATLVYSTHYSELLDESSRCDNIHVLHRSGDTIEIKNLYQNYHTRVELSKSKRFDQNAFDTNLNYDNLMNLRRAILHDSSSL